MTNQSWQTTPSIGGPLWVPKLKLSALIWPENFQIAPISYEGNKYIFVALNNNLTQSCFAQYQTESFYYCHHLSIHSRYAWQEVSKATILCIRQWAANTAKGFLFTNLSSKKLYHRKNIENTVAQTIQTFNYHFISFYTNQTHISLCNYETISYLKLRTLMFCIACNNQSKSAYGILHGNH